MHKMKLVNIRDYRILSYFILIFPQFCNITLYLACVSTIMITRHSYYHLNCGVKRLILCTPFHASLLFYRFPWLFEVLDTSDAAERIIRGVRRNQEEIFLPEKLKPFMVFSK